MASEDAGEEKYLWHSRWLQPDSAVRSQTKTNREAIATTTHALPAEARAKVGGAVGLGGVGHEVRAAKARMDCALATSAEK